MNHQPTAEQMVAAKELGEVVQLEDKSLLNVPDDVNLDRYWFVGRATEILGRLGGPSVGDTVHVMGQPQLVAAVQAFARNCEAKIVESVNPRISKEVPQEDGTVRKENVFSFSGFREVHKF